MAPARITWQQKVRGLLEERRLSARKLAKQMGEEERSVRAWVSGDTRPLNEIAIVARMAAALRVPIEWLQDGREGTPPTLPPSMVISEDLVRAVPSKYRRLAYALADPDAADWLLAQLELYDRARKRGRASP